MLATRKDAEYLVPRKAILSSGIGNFYRTGWKIKLAEDYGKQGQYEKVDQFKASY